MKLDRVEIKNFRSIKDVTVKFDPQCRVLVGVNESGKSNILKALSFLDSEFKPVKQDDLREALPDEGIIEKSHVWFIFGFEKSDSDELLEAVTSKILSSSKNPEIISTNGSNKNIKDICTSQREGLYCIDIRKEDKSFSYWDFGKEYEVLSGWKKPISACPPNAMVAIKGEQYFLSKFKLVRTSDLESIPTAYLEDATFVDLKQLVGNAVREVTENNLPEALFWEYDENNLLPGLVDINAFSLKPSSCLPLKNMFTLAGVKDIRTEIATYKTGTLNQFQNFLDRVAKQTTTHFRDVWKEYKHIEFSLKLNGEHVVPGVKEKNTHDFARRSDGFKRFVTFLLMISVNVKTESLRDTLLLIDEPDVSLHPSGARYLRDELIKISKTNHVVYSTHSIFMIDPQEISRHYIVKKAGEVTTIETAQQSNISDEEVLFNALGHSIFAVLKEKNLIFEGWYDKRLFSIAIQNASPDLKKKFKDVGICHSTGVKAIKTITPMIELAKRKCLVISDSDNTAKEQQKLFRQEEGYGEWKNYQEVDSKIEALTGEDFIKNDFVTKQVNAVCPRPKKFEESSLPAKNGKIIAITNWLRESGVAKTEINDVLAKIKKGIFENLSHKNIEDDYTAFLEKLPL